MTSAGPPGLGEQIAVTRTAPFRRGTTELHRARLARARTTPIEGLEHIDKIIEVDQTPIGRTPRSNPATYTGAVRPDPRPVRQAARGASARLQAGPLLFNVKGGRCEACEGNGAEQDRDALPARRLGRRAIVCHGKRYNRETLEVHYKGKSIADVLDMTVEEALEFFEQHPEDPPHAADAARRRPRLHPPRPAGPDALRRRGPARQARDRAVAAAHRPHALHPRRADDRPALRRLAASCSRCCTAWSTPGNTVVVIEHNLDVIKTADWIIDLGPEGGDGGGRVVADRARRRRSWPGTPASTTRTERVHAHKQRRIAAPGPRASPS